MKEETIQIIEKEFTKRSLYEDWRTAEEVAGDITAIFTNKIQVLEERIKNNAGVFTIANPTTGKPMAVLVKEDVLKLIADIKGEKTNG